MNLINGISEIKHNLTGIEIRLVRVSGNDFVGVIVSNPDKDIRYKLGQKIKTSIKLIGVTYTRIK